jgi:hypothetical protein
MGGLAKFTERPWVPAVWRFYKTLGRQSGLIQAAEVALRFFEAVGEHRKEGFEEFLRKRASACGLSIGLKGFSDARESAAKWYIVETCQIWDSFTKDLNDDYRRYKQIRDWKFRVGKETLPAFQQLLLNLPTAKARAIRGQPEFEILQYYFAVRNWIVHRTIETAREARRCLEALLSKHASYLKRRYRTNAPNPTDSLQFDDYMLFSKGIVFFATEINDACDLQNEDIESALFSAHRKVLRNHTMKFTRIRKLAVAYFTFFHGPNKERRSEFADYVVERFQNGRYFK